MSRYNEQYVKLDELGKVGRGKSKHRPRNDSSLFGGNYPFIQTGDVRKAEFYLTEFSETYNEKGLAQSKLWDKDTLCITIAANIAENAILGIKACFPDSIIGFLPDKKKADLKFIKYCLDTYKIQIQSISQGATQDNLSLEKLRSINFLVPELSTQKMIGSVLFNYDQLIENNTKRIAILEQMAEQIYKEWFVRMRFPGHQNTKFIKGIPEGWEVIQFQKIVQEIRKGIKKEQINPNIEYVGLEHLPVKSLILSNWGKGEDIDSDKLRFETNDILFCKIRPYLHKVAIAPFNGICSTDTIIMRPLKPEYQHYSSLIAISNVFVDFADITSNGTKMPRADWKVLKKFQCLYPGEELLLKFNKMVTPLLEECKILMGQNKTLESSRNLLLPRLISGKLSVEKLSATLQEAV